MLSTEKENEIYSFLLKIPLASYFEKYFHILLLLLLLLLLIGIPKKNY